MLAREPARRYYDITSTSTSITMAARPRRATMVKRVTASDEDITQFLSTTTEVLAKGYLKKLSSKGKWQQRFFELRGPYFM